MPGPVHSAQAMIAGMQPVLWPGEFVFCSTEDPAVIARALPDAIASFREAEGMSLVLPRGAAEALGFDAALPMRRITLTVFSALDGVGLTAAVSAALAGQGIPCNMVAGFHHDHLFIPSGMADRALTALRAVQGAAATGQ